MQITQHNIVQNAFKIINWLHNLIQEFVFIPKETPTLLQADGKKNLSNSRCCLEYQGKFQIHSWKMLIV